VPLANIFVDEKLKTPLTHEFSTSLGRTINGGKGWRKGRDIDNVLKPLMDFLQHIGAITDDCAEVVNSIYIRFTPPGKPADKSYVDVVVQPA